MSDALQDDDIPSSSPAARKLIEVPIALRWRDLDAFNHVNNSSFLTYIEEARLNWFSGMQGAWFTDTTAPVVAAIQINYRRQLAWPRQIVVELYCKRLGNSSLTLSHRLVDAADRAVLYSDGEAVLVWIDTSTGNSVALPAAIRTACK